LSQGPLKNIGDIYKHIYTYIYRIYNNIYIYMNI
jgi:hypothetical protein